MWIKFSFGVVKQIICYTIFYHTFKQYKEVNTSNSDQWHNLDIFCEYTKTNIFFFLVGNSEQWRLPTRVPKLHNSHKSPLVISMPDEFDRFQNNLQTDKFEIWKFHRCFLYKWRKGLKIFHGQSYWKKYKESNRSVFRIDQLN